jgi:hypothetical protein
MKNLLFLIISLCVLISTAFPQTLSTVNSSKSFLTPTLNLSSGNSLRINASTLVSDVQNDPFRGYVGFNISGLVNIDYSVDGHVTDLVENTDKISTWGLSFKILPQKDKYPSISITLRSSIDWKLTELFNSNIRKNNEFYFRRGLNQVNYEYRISIVNLIFSHNIGETINLTSGIGIQELQYRSLRIFTIDNYIHRNDITRNLLLHGFLNGSFDINNSISVITEFNSLPHLVTNLKDYILTVKRSYVAALGMRYSLSNLFAIETAVCHYTNFGDVDRTQFRVGLNSKFDLN